jgi:heme exporter protein D
MVLCLLQVSNLKKIVQGFVDYYQECLNQHLTDFSRPDVFKIGNNGIYVLSLRAVTSAVIVLLQKVWYRHHKALPNLRDVVREKQPEFQWRTNSS